MRTIRELSLPPWAVGLVVFLLVASAWQLVLSGGALLVAVPSGVVAGAVSARHQRRREAGVEEPPG